VFVVVLLLGLSNSAFAQVSCGTASTPVSRDTLTGLTEPAGDITFNCVQAGPAATTAATITVDYQGSPITNSTTYPTGKPISITGGAAPCTAPPTISAGSVSNTTGQIVINVPAEGPGIVGTCSFTLTGVLFGLSGTAKTTVVATLSVSPGNNLTLTSGETTPTVVTSVLDGVCPGASGCTPVGITGSPATILASSGLAVGSSAGTVSIVEHYIDFFRSITQFNGGAAMAQTQGVQLLYTFAGIPTNATLTCAGSMNTGAGAGVGTGTITLTPAGGAVNSAAPTLTAEIAGTANLSAIDTVALNCTYANGTATLPLTNGAITVTATLAPIGTAFGAANAVQTSATTGQIPRYTASTLGPVTVINFISATTNILFPFVTLSSTFDTGFAIANTTADPYGAPTGAGLVGGARAQSGAVTLAFYPAATAAGVGTPFCVQSGAGATAVAGIASCFTLDLTKSLFSGTGLSSGGVVSSGSMWTFVLSDLIKSTTVTSFSGYVFGISNFSNAHSTSFVADPAFAKFGVGGPSLVLPNPTVSGFGRSQLGNGLAESLGH